MIKPHTAWTREELQEQGQVIFSAHLALMFDYIQRNNLSVDDFIHFIGERAAPGWKRTASGCADFMNGILLNVLAGGGTVHAIYIDETEAHATVSGVVNPRVLEYYSVPADLAARFWNKYIPIAEALHMRFIWDQKEDGTFVIQVRDES